MAADSRSLTPLPPNPEFHYNEIRTGNWCIMCVHWYIFGDWKLDWDWQSVSGFSLILSRRVRLACPWLCLWSLDRAIACGCGVVNVKEVGIYLFIFYFRIAEAKRMLNLEPSARAQCSSLLTITRNTNMIERRRRERASKDLFPGPKEYYSFDFFKN